MKVAPCQRTAGFVLLEILVSFTILALILGAVLGALSDGMRAVTGSAEYTGAVLLARSKLEAFRAESSVDLGEARDPVNDGPTSGRFGSYRWQVTVSPYDAEPEVDFDALAVEPMVVEVEVSWSSSGQGRSVELTTLHLEPKK